MAGPWAQHGDQLVCELHGETFSRLSVCPGCSAAPVAFDATAESEPLPTPPPGCLTSHDLEARFVDLGNMMSQGAKAILNDPGSEREDRSLAVRMVVEATKAYRAAAECARSREVEFAVDRRVRQLSALKGKVRH